MGNQAKKPKKRLISMDTEEVSVVNAGANGHTEWLIVKGADGKDVVQGIPVDSASDELKKSALDSRSVKYGIEKMSEGGRLTVGEGLPTSEALYGDPVNLRYPMGDGENQASESVLKDSISQFRKDHAVYEGEVVKSRIFERLVRKGLSLGMSFAHDPEDTINKLLPADITKRLAKEHKENQDVPPTADPGTPNVEPSTENRAKSGPGADLVTGLDSTLKKGREALAFGSVLRLKDEVNAALDTVRKSKPEPGATSSNSDEVGNDTQPDPAVETLTKTVEEKDEQIQRLTKALNTERANKSRRSTAIGTSQTLRPRETRKTADAPEPEISDSTRDIIDLSPALEDPRS